TTRRSNVQVHRVGNNDYAKLLHVDDDSTVIRWEKPSRQRFKCNVDVSFSSSRNRVGLGMCIRDDDGSFVLAKTMWILPLCNVDVGEALGVLHAINWVHELQLEGVDFALNSKKVVDYFHKGRNDVTEFGDVV
ncbi:cytochrome P450, partial [Trifolium medium]|nr:cytochrome P450 [Trifolium medium]